MKETNENTNERRNNVLFWGMVGIGLGAVGFGCYCAHQTKVCRELIGAASTRIAEMSQVDIDQSIVDRAVEKAVREQSGNAVNRALSRIEEQTKADLRNRVKQAVANASEKINSRVALQLVKETEELSADEIRKDVVEQATEKLVEKLAEELDDEVGKIGEVYLNIAHTIANAVQ